MFNSQEATLADSSSQRPLIITIGAVLVTIIVVAGIVLWPSASTCLQGGNTFGTCLEQSLTGGPGDALTPEDDGEVSAESDLPGGEDGTDGADDGEPETAQPDSQDTAESPVIDARVEPDGSTIFAGTVEPNAQIHLFANGTEIGQTTADNVGDWIIIPDAPLAAGGVAITMGTSVNGNEITPLSQALAVVVDEGQSDQPTVVASAPDEVSSIIEDLVGSPPDIATNVMSEEKPPVEIADIEPEQAPEVSDTETPDAELVGPEAEQPAEDEPAQEERMETADVSPEQVPDVSGPDSANPDADLITPEPDEGEQETPVDTAAVAPDQIVPEPPVTPEPPEVTVEPSIDAVEIETDRAYIAGAGEDGSMVRLFVDDQFVGDSIVEGGRWLVETDQEINEPSQRIRAEMIAPDSDIVTAEAEINFVIEQPENSANNDPLILPDDQLSPIEMPSEGPLVVADAPPDAIELSDEALSDMELPAGAPNIETEPESVETDEPATQVADVPEPEMTIPEDQLAPIELPTQAPGIDMPESVEQEMQVADMEESLILPEDQVAPIELPTQAPTIDVPASDTEMEVANAEVDQGQLMLSEDQLAPIALPTEAPGIDVPATDVPIDVPADAPIVTAEAEPQMPLILPEDQLAPINLPTEAPNVDTPSDAPVVTADAEPQAPLILPEDQLSPIALPTEAPNVEAPNVEVPNVEVPADAPIVSAETEPQAPLILPEDQLAPIALPAEAPKVDIPVDELIDEPVVSAESELQVPLVLPEEQLAPITLPTEAPNVDAPVSAPMATAEAEPQVPLTLPEDQLAPIALPTEAPKVDVSAQEPLVVAETETPDMAPENAQTSGEDDAALELESGSLILPDDQLAPIDLPNEAPPIDVAEGDVAVPAAQLPEVRLPEPEMNLPEGAPLVVADGSGQDETEESAEPDDMPTLVATPIGDPEDGRFASGNVIIRHGDNLWTIARRVYGRGIQYQVIFEANRTKINDPDLIFPGQVFDLPGNGQGPGMQSGSGME